MSVQVLGIVDGVVADLQRRRPPGPARLESNLERDLGLDSLALAEVMVSLEDAFGIDLPAAVLATAATVGDLVRVVSGAAPRRGEHHHAVARRPRQEESLESPLDAGTLVGVLDWHCATHPDRQHLHLVDDDGSEETVTYAQLRASGGAVAEGLLAAGLRPGDRVALMLPTSRRYFDAFVGVLLAGGVPVPIYPPSRPSQIAEHLRRHVVLLSNAGAVMLLTVAEAMVPARLLRSSVESLRRIATVEALAASEPRGDLPAPDPMATALIQYTSGSTGQPKGVVLSHAAVLANIRAMGEAAEVTPDDVFVSWLPLYHDMGLIGAWMGSLCLDMTAVIMSPLTFLARPSRWLAALSEYRGTITAAPNFAYELCLRKVSDADMAGLDLSCVRMALNASEPVVAGTVERFAARFAPYGLNPGALTPVFGLAESAVGLAFPPLGRGLHVDHVAADPLRREGRAEPVAAGAGALAIVGCGRPLPGYELRVVDDSGRAVGERTEGRLEFRGPSVTSGYFRNAEATAALFHDGWLVTGDLAYLADGELFITGRTKDLIIVAGRNLHPEDLETAVGRIPGVREGCVAVFGVRRADDATERLVVVAESREASPEVGERIRRDIAALAVELLGTAADDIVLAPPGSVPKTSSGKIRRAACAELYEGRLLLNRRRPSWWQVAGFVIASGGPRLRRRWREAGAVLYGLWCGVALVAVVAPTLGLLAVVPRPAWRRRLVRGAARALMWLTGTRVGVLGGDHLGVPGPSVVVANHASWLDSLVLTAILPPRFSFVAGEVLQGQAVAGFLLRRIGAVFVERSETGHAVADAARLAHLAREESLVVFPEGGLSRAAGLRPFHLGAFVAATEAGRPVVPVAVRGTRSMLPAGRRLMRRGSVTVVVSDAVLPSGEGWAGAVQLAHEVRGVLLRHSGEPDLG